MMNCPRCNGLMVVDHLIDMQDDSGQLWVSGWKCAACGEFLDPAICQRRAMQQEVRLKIAAAQIGLPKSTDSVFGTRCNKDKTRGRGMKVALMR